MYQDLNFIQEICRSILDVGFQPQSMSPCIKNSKMTRFAEASLKERALIPNFMQPSPRYSIKREEIENKRVIHALTMNNRYKYKSSSREEHPYTMY